MADWQWNIHGECDCVPELGPSHCHLCGEAEGHPVPWDEAQKLHRLDIPVVGAVLPEGLCGALSRNFKHCVLTPHPEGSPHSWQKK